MDQWWRRVPKEPLENLRFRRFVLEKAAASKPLQEALKEACRRDTLFYFNVFVWTYDPRLRSKTVPLITWDCQDRAVKTVEECIDEGIDLVIEKSRDMGASWLSLAVMEKKWHFEQGCSFLMVSRKAELVDSPGDPDSLFWKVDFIHRHLPDWLLPKMERRKLHFENQDTGSTIDGESTTAAAGVGGRRTAVFIDEFSRIDEGYQLLAGTADTTRCRIFNFTPYGTSNAAYKLARRGDIRKLRLHWSEHPVKRLGLYCTDERNQVKVIDKGYEYPLDFHFVLDGKLRSPWYDEECRRRANDREVAQMLDIDYLGSAYQFFDKTMIMVLQAEYATPPFWEGDVSFDPDTGRGGELVRCSGGPLKLWLHPNSQNRPPRDRYGAGGDISSGSGATNSCFSLASATTGEKVLEYTSPFLKAEQFAIRCVALCWLFCDDNGEPTLFAWEMIGPGQAFGKRVIELGFRNVFYRVNEQMLAPHSRADVPGWFPSNDNRRLLLEQYRAALSSRQYLNRSSIALEECLSFVHSGKGVVEHSEVMDEIDPSGAGANHGDRVIADALSNKMVMLLGRPSVKKEQEAHAAPGSLAWRRQWNERQRESALAWS